MVYIVDHVHPVDGNDAWKVSSDRYTPARAKGHSLTRSRHSGERQCPSGNWRWVRPLLGMTPDRALKTLAVLLAMLVVAGWLVRGGGSLTMASSGVWNWSSLF